MTKVILWTITIFCFLTCGYCFLGLMMVAMLSAGPNYSPERAQFNINFWVSCMLTFFILGVMFSVLIWKGRNRKPKGC